MTTKNAILLIVKQNPGIDYNSLLNKFASSYSNANSARAALSRSLKDLTVFAFLSRKENRYYLLDKGEGEIYSEIKNKLVIALNSVMKEKNPVNEIDQIVEKLQILIERGRQDRDLLKTSKSSLDFSISHLEDISGQLEKKVKHLEYLSRIFNEHIKSLKELDFNDSFSRQNDPQSISLLLSIFSSQPDNELTVECQNLALLEAASAGVGAKIRNTSFTLQKDSVASVLEGLGNHKTDLLLKPFNIFSSVLKAQLFRDSILLSGPYTEIQKWKQAANP